MFLRNELTRILLSPKEFFAMEKLFYTFRTHLCYNQIFCWVDTNDTIQGSSEGICNVHFDGTGWQQAIFSNEFDGLAQQFPVKSVQLASRTLINEVLFNSTELTMFKAYEITYETQIQHGLDPPQLSKNGTPSKTRKYYIDLYISNSPSQLHVSTPFISLFQLGSDSKHANIQVPFIID